MSNQNKMNLIKLESYFEIYHPLNGKLIYNYQDDDNRRHGSELFLGYLIDTMEALSSTIKI